MSSISYRFFFLGLLFTLCVSTIVFAGSLQSSFFDRTNTPSFSKANLATEKGTYARGEIVLFYGNGFRSFEEVSLSVDNYIGGLKQNVEIIRWTVFADVNGEFSASIPFDSLNSDNGKFVLRAFGEKSRTKGETFFSQTLGNPSADLDQCGNGPFSNPSPCSGSNWQNGNVGQSQGHYYEGDSIPYRIKFDNLDTGGSNPHSLTIEWDTTQGGKHAIDYVTTYNRTEFIGNNPCSGVVPACGPATTFPIPLDPNVSSAGVTQIGGQVFTMWGATITSVSAYTLSGSYLGNSATRITINFTANQANPVLAWSGHIADRQDWATMGGSASDISGSPYHTRLIDLDGGGGNQDRSLSNVAVRLNSKIVIIKQASPETTMPFGFTATGLSLPSFSLIDDGTDNDATPNNISFNNLLAPSLSGSFTVMESPSGGFYSLQSINCTVSSGGTSTFLSSVGTRTSSITLQYGDTVTCTFNNNVTTAAGVSASGRITDKNGNGLPRVKIFIQNTSTLDTQTTYSNQFGNYQFDGLPAGEFYTVTVLSKKYVFEQNSQGMTLNDSVSDINFVGGLE